MVDHPLLPFELWSQILELVVYIPIGADTELKSPFDDRLLEESDPNGTFKRVMRDKLSISLVCKLWRSIVRENTFDTRCFGGIVNVQAVLRAIRSKGQEDDSKGSDDELQRIFDGCRYWEMTGDAACMGSPDYAPARCAFSRCRNLVTYKQVGGHTPDDILFGWKHSGPSLRRLEFRRTHIWSTLPWSLTTYTHQLQILILDVKNQKDLAWRPNISVPSLHTLVFEASSSSLFATFEFPNLKRLDLTLSTKIDIPKLGTFPKSLRYLSLRGEGPTGDPDYEEILKAFPVLEVAIFAISILPPYGPTLSTSYPFLRKVGIEVTGKPPVQLATTFFGLPFGHEYLPSLTQIRLFQSNTSAWHFSGTMGWELYSSFWASKLQPLGIQLDLIKS